MKTVPVKISISDNFLMASNRLDVAGALGSNNNLVLSSLVVIIDHPTLRYELSLILLRIFKSFSSLHVTFTDS